MRKYEDRFGEEVFTRCPKCGNTDCAIIYEDEYGECAGCDRCLYKIYIEETEDEDEQ